MHSYGLTNPTPSLLFQLLTLNSITVGVLLSHQTYLGASHEATYRLLPLPIFILLTPWTSLILQICIVVQDIPASVKTALDVQSFFFSLLRGVSGDSTGRWLYWVLSCRFYLPSFHSYIFTTAFYTATFFRFDPNFP